MVAASNLSKWYHFVGNNAVEIEAKSAEESVRKKYPLLLHENEHIEMAFTNRGGLGRDKSYFTTHRILLKDGKGIGGKRKNYTTIFYHSIQCFSVSTAGKWDGDVDLKLMSTGKDSVSVAFSADFDIFAIQQYLNTKSNWTEPQGTEDYVPAEPLASSSETSSSCGSLIDWIGNNAKQFSAAETESKFKTEFPLLMDDEKVELAFKAGRDFTILTNKRYLEVDVQGLFGKKVEFKSFPYRTFSGFSVQTTAAMFDRDTEMILYTNIMGYGKIHQDFRQGSADIFAIQKVLSNKILGEDSAVNDSVDTKQGHSDPKTSWWFRDNQRPLDAVEVNKYYHDVVPLLLNSETVEMAFKGRRDITLFTTKRVIDIDPKGLTGAQIEYISVPWKSVVGFAVQTAGKLLDSTCEAMIYTDMMFFPGVKKDDDDEGEPEPLPGMSFWELDFNKNMVDVLAVKKYLSSRILKQADNIPVPQNVYMTSNQESGIENFLSKIGNDQRAIDPSEMNTLLHTTHPVLLDDENTIMAFKSGRDATLFTNLRVMIIDVQGLTGAKVEYKSIPYESIRAFSAESAGGWDRDSEVKLYTRNLWTMGKVKLDFRKGKADIIAIQKFLGAICLNSREEAARFLESREPENPKTDPVKFDSFVAFLTDNSSALEASVVDAQLHSDPPILLDDEHVKRAFRQGRDMFVYTNERILFVDVQGLSGKKMEYKSIPWTYVQGFEFETAGNLDRDAEMYFHNDIPGRLEKIKHSILVKNFDIYTMHEFVYKTMLFDE